jgi:hypothetical protein
MGARDMNCFPKKFYESLGADMTETPVTIEALEAAAKMAGFADFSKRYDGDELTNGFQDALARMIQKHEPELIAESFEARTHREFKEMIGPLVNQGWDLNDMLASYRQLVKQWQKDTRHD